MGNLIECPMCGKMISPNAEMCPNCGEPMKKNNEQKEEHKEEQSEDKYCIILEEAGKTSSDVNYKLINLLGIDMDTAISMTEYPPYLILDDLKLEEAKDYKSKLEGVGATISIELDKENSSNSEYKSDFNYIEKSHAEDNKNIKDTQDVEDNTIKCPNCKSTNVRKISGLSKAGSVALIGIFSMGKLAKTYECNKCGYRW